MIYPFDVNSAITWLGVSFSLNLSLQWWSVFFFFSFVSTVQLMYSCRNVINAFFLWAGEQADLIFVFFDPMGQALCKRTLNIVEKLSQKCADKLLFYLSKADEAGKETDRQVSLPDLYNLFLFQRKLNLWDELFFSHQRVMMQIVQELCRRPGLNKCGFEMPTIYIPNPQKVKWSVLVTLNCCVCIKITSGCANIINHGSAVIAAPSYDLQPRSVRGRFVHPSRPLLHFCWASAASLSAKSTRLSVRMPSGFVMELSRPSFIEMCRVFFMFSPNLTCLRAVCLM